MADVLEALFTVNFVKPGQWATPDALVEYLRRERPLTPWDEHAVIAMLVGLGDEGLAIRQCEVSISFDRDGWMTHAAYAYSRMGAQGKATPIPWETWGTEFELSQEPDPLLVLGHVDEFGRVHFAEGAHVE